MGSKKFQLNSTADVRELDFTSDAGADNDADQNTGRKKADIRRRSVQFTSDPPRIIPRATSLISAHTEDEFIMHDFSATSKANRRSRIVKLLVMLALPTVVVFAQCGLMISRAIQRHMLHEEAARSVDYIKQTLRTVSGLQQERRATVLYMTRSRSSPKNLTGIEDRTDAVLSELDLQTNLPDKAKVRSNLNNGTRSWNLRTRTDLNAHRTAVLSLNASRSEEILHYSKIITEVISRTPKNIYLTSDDDGLMWRDLVALELLFKISDSLKLEQDLTLSLFALSVLAPEEIRWISENRSDIQILFKLSLKFLDLSTTTIEAETRKKELLLRQADYLDSIQQNEHPFDGQDHNSLFGNLTLDSLMEHTELLVEFVDNITVSCLSRIGKKMEEEKSIINRESALAYGLLAAVLILFPILGIFYVRSVNTMAEVIAAYSGDMLMKSAELNFEKKRTDHLLFQMLPKSVANSLTSNQAVNAESYDCVSIYFSDIVDFEQLTTSYEPLKVIDLLNSLYMMFDTEIDNFDVYKVETIGDAYMVASGLPTRNENRHAAELANMSLSLMNLASAFSLPNMPGRRLLLRIGINSGPCVTCVIGLKMPRYCLFGDTVNTASRMQSHGSALRIHMSAATKVILESLGGYEFSSRGAIDVKGKGIMMTWWLTGREGFDFHIDLSETETYVK